jgi:hypothetical protein
LLCNRERFSAFAIAAFVGIAVRVVIYLSSTGSNDIRTWEWFAHLIDEAGFAGAYSLDPRLNHPPVACALALAALHVGSRLGVGFALAFKLLPLVADIGTIFLIRSYFRASRDDPRSWLYALSLPSVFISSYHGNTDALCVFFLTLSIYCLQLPRNAFYASLALAAAVNIKIIPLLLVVPMIVTLQSAKERLRFLMGFGLGMVPIMLGVLFLGAEFRSNIFAYRSTFQPWGITFFLYRVSNLFDVTPFDYSRIASGLIVAGIVGLSGIQWKFRRFSQLESASLVMSIFLVLAAGFGSQYLIYVAPLMVMLSSQWSVRFFTVGGLFCVLWYYQSLISYWPLASRHHIFSPSVSLFGAFTWLTIVGFLNWVGRHRRQSLNADATFGAPIGRAS